MLCFLLANPVEKQMRHAFQKRKGGKAKTANCPAPASKAHKKSGNHLLFLIR